MQPLAIGHLQSLQSFGQNLPLREISPSPKMHGNQAPPSRPKALHLHYLQMHCDWLALGRNLRMVKTGIPDIMMCSSKDLTYRQVASLRAIGKD